MFKRIRYQKDGENLISVKSYQHDHNGSRYRVKLLLNEKTYNIVDETVDVVVTTGAVSVNTSDFHKLKIAAKRALENLGIQFMEEPRQERKTVSAA